MRRLRAFHAFDSGNQRGWLDLQHLAELEEHLHSRRLLVLLKQTDVVARNPRLGRKGLLRQLGPDSFCAQFIA